MGRPKNGRNQKRTWEEKMQLLMEYYESGVGYRVFAQEHGISPSLFYSWIKKYNESGADGLRYKRKVYNKIPEQPKDNDEIVKLKLIIAEQQIEIQNLRSKLEQMDL